MLSPLGLCQRRFIGDFSRPFGSNVLQTLPSAARWLVRGEEPGSYAPLGDFAQLALRRFRMLQNFSAVLSLQFQGAAALLHETGLPRLHG